jgi:hypothetical protein
MLNRLTDIELPKSMLCHLRQEELEQVLKTDCTGEVYSLGKSREDRALYGLCIGQGKQSVSVIAGAHADEPTGSVTALLFPWLLDTHYPELLERFTFRMIPQINPDGAERNRRWFALEPDFGAYISGVLREEPGDDVEFGFGSRTAVRPECRAAMTFLKRHGPYAAHFSLHSMPYNEGVWFLISPNWQERAAALMNNLSAWCRAAGFVMHDIDRRGEKGFFRIGPGFSTTPNSVAMRAFFQAQGQPETAAKFQPSSMEFISGLGGDPLCMVSEVPLFLLENETPNLADPAYYRFRQALDSAVKEKRLEAVIAQYGVTPVPLEQQVRLQLAMMLLGLEAVLH